MIQLSYIILWLSDKILVITRALIRSWGALRCPCRTSSGLHHAYISWHDIKTCRLASWPHSKNFLGLIGKYLTAHGGGIYVWINRCWTLLPLISSWCFQISSSKLFSLCQPECPWVTCLLWLSDFHDTDSIDAGSTIIKGEGLTNVRKELDTCRDSMYTFYPKCQAFPHQWLAVFALVRPVRASVLPSFMSYNHYVITVSKLRTLPLIFSHWCIKMHFYFSCLTWQYTFFTLVSSSIF